jgi:hypothetical protein
MLSGTALALRACHAKPRFSCDLTPHRLRCSIRVHLLQCAGGAIDLGIYDRLASDHDQWPVDGVTAGRTHWSGRDQPHAFRSAVQCDRGSRIREYRPADQCRRARPCNERAGAAHDRGPGRHVAQRCLHDCEHIRRGARLQHHTAHVRRARDAEPEHRRCRIRHVDVHVPAAPLHGQLPRDIRYRATGRTAFVNGQIQVATGRYTPPCT